MFSYLGRAGITSAISIRVYRAVKTRGGSNPTLGNWESILFAIIGHEITKRIILYYRNSIPNSHRFGNRHSASRNREGETSIKAKRATYNAVRDRGNIAIITCTPQSSLSWGTSMYDVRTEGGGGSGNIPNLQTNSIDFADREGEGLKIKKNFTSFMETSLCM